MAPQKKRFEFGIEQELIDRLESLKARTGLSLAEQVRRAVEMWIETREWPGT
jgi:predicted DNA-binding protein